MNALVYRRTQKSVRATTLVEVIVAMLIIVSLAFGSYAAFISARQAVSVSIDQIAAINAAREVLEQLRNLVSADPTRALPLQAGTYTYPITGNTNLTSPVRTVVIEDVDMDGNPATQDDIVKKVTVTVSWG
jgi:type II secretory pathway pseudopilin PulG